MFLTLLEQNGFVSSQLSSKQKKWKGFLHFLPTLTVIKIL